MEAAVVGAGSWGTALARVLATKGTPVRLWCRSAEVADVIRAKRENAKYLPGVALPEPIRPVTEFAEALAQVELVIHCVPSHATREVARRYAPHLPADCVVVSATKGLEYGSFKRMTEVVREETGHPVAALSGPNHAEEVARDLPTGTVIAHHHYPVARRVAEALTTETFRAYAHPDVAGVEVCGAYKNVVALAGGLGAGLGFGDNALASLITLGLHEMGQLIPLLDGERRTAYGLAGIGDLVATCTSKHSRNRRFGEALGRGATVAEAAEMLHGQVAEGVTATRAFHAFAEGQQMRLPLLGAMNDLLEGRVAPKEGLGALVRSL